MQMRKGFTLIELLVVIAIIGILATLVITQVSGAQVRARNSNAKSDINQIGKAIELYRNDDSNSTSQAVDAAAGAADAQVSITLNDATGTSVATGPAAWKARFSGTQNTTAGTYGVAINKVPSAAYTYTYTTKSNPAPTVGGSAAYCTLIGVTSTATPFTPYSIKNGANNDATQTISATAGQC